MALYAHFHNTVKGRAEEVLSRLGIPMSMAINMYLNQISFTGIEAGKVQNAASAFAKFKENH